MATGFPGYDGSWPREAACIAEILQGNQYSTAAFGKWHNTPDHELSAAGPFDRWPTGKGFGYWYGFQGGEASQWHTPLFENTAPIEPPHDNPKWHFTEAIADRTISWIGQQQAAAPDMPFFIYFAPGACHSPHHVHKEWADKYKGKFDHGWDRQRELTLENQKKIEILPKDTKLTPRPDSIPSGTLVPQMRSGFTRECRKCLPASLNTLMLKSVRLWTQSNEWDSVITRSSSTSLVTMVPSAEGSLTGTLNNMKTQLGLLDDVSKILEKIDEIGGPLHENHYPVGWAWGRIVTLPVDEASCFALRRHEKRSGNVLAKRN
jgi:arylsulfatase